MKVRQGLLQLMLGTQFPGFITIKLFASRNNQTISSPELPFAFLPTDNVLNLSGVLRNETLLRCVTVFQHSVTTLDISKNGLKDISFLAGFRTLEVLSLSDNELDDSIMIPRLEYLRVLHIDTNQIQDIISFVEKLRVNCPFLTDLNTLKNPCCPYFKDGTGNDEYNRYRYVFVWI